MYKYLLILLAFISCSSFDKSSFDKSYFERPLNKESELLNQYLQNFIKRTEPFNSKSEIYLFDTLKPVTKSFSQELKEASNYCKEEKFKEALLDLSRTEKQDMPINFSQIENIEKMNIHPGSLKNGNYSYNNWEYSLSLPGFSKDSSYICFTSSYYCGPLCACFSIIYMKKENNGWIYVKEDIILIS